MLQRVRLAGATPRLAPWAFDPSTGWRLDLDALAARVGRRTRALFIMNPSMPSGGVLDAEDWAAVRERRASGSISAGKLLSLSIDICASTKGPRSACTGARSTSSRRTIRASDPSARNALISYRLV
ncbi:aminotransferase class I/II-fold pyridoxal phosphate-dependent enzyme [Candidatus Palauibacter sp.]|uniref:aminotransferase class I/II-fold pyridoxal phosphate-dependent enzyme n=1 Tax=Candidatus Palauibacter sp. TaxID=3101350 RepID=UPI003C6F6309